jgi:hypothetical protein
MVPSTFITAFLTQLMLAAAPRQRWEAMRQMHNSTSSSNWFTWSMLAVLSVLIVILAVVTLCRRISESRAARRAFFEDARRRGLSESEADILMAVAAKSGLKARESIFSMKEYFEHGAEELLDASRSDGQPTDETVHLERQLAGLRDKLGFQKISKTTAGAAVKKEDGVSVHKKAFIALFPFEKKLNPASGGGNKRPQQSGSLSPPGLGAEGNRLFPEFVSATVTGLVGRVVFIETTLAANVGDRVLVLAGSSDTEESIELIQDIGLVQQSAQPAEINAAPQARRLAVALVGANEAQAALLVNVLAGAKQAEVKAAQEPVVLKEGL